MAIGVKVEEQKRLQALHATLRRTSHPSKAALAKAIGRGGKTVQRVCRRFEELFGAEIGYCTANKGYFYKTEPPGLDEMVQGVRIDSPDRIHLALAVKALSFVQLDKVAGELRDWVRSLSGVGLDVMEAELDNQLSFAEMRRANVHKKDLALLFDAIRSRQPVSFDYKSVYKDEKTSRTVDPYHLTYRESAWYLIGFDRGRQAKRTFSLGRMARIKVHKAEGLSPPPFDPKEHFRSGGIIQNGKPFTVHLVFEAKAAELVMEREYAFDYINQAKPYRLDKDNRLHLRFRHTSLPALLPIVLSFGKEVEIRQPKALREEAREHYMAALERLK